MMILRNRKKVWKLTKKKNVYCEVRQSIYNGAKKSNLCIYLRIEVNRKRGEDETFIKKCAV